MHRLPLVVTLVSWTFLAVGCDQLTATTQAVSVLTASPDLATADGFDAQLTSLGLIDLDTLSANSAVGIAVGVAEKQSATSTAAPTAVEGALVHIAWSAGNVALCSGGDLAAGTYSASNVPQPSLPSCSSAALAYLADDTYTTTIETSSSQHTIRVVAPPPIAAGDGVFTPALGTSPISGLSLKSHELSAALSVDWGGAPEAGDRHAFVTIARINFAGDTADAMSVATAANWTADAQNPVYNSAPTEPSQMIALVINPPETSADIPADVFSQAGLYFLIVTTAELSTDVSSNLAIGSGGSAGKGTAFVFFVN